MPGWRCLGGKVGQADPAAPDTVAPTDLLLQIKPQMRSAERPLSPHLQIYRWQLTSVLSILHRASGVALSVGAAILVWWLVAAASGPEAYDTAANFLGSWLGIVLLLGWSAALFYHLCNGIRHLVWDTGHALDLKSVYTGGWIVVAAAAVLTLIAWAAGMAHWAG